MKKKFYITTAIPYLNAPPHIGHAFEFVQTDFIARYHRLKGEEVLLLSGGDENALKNVQAAEKAGKPIQEFIDHHASLFQNLAENLNVKFNVFQRGTNQERHFPSSQKLWKLCEKNGDIYKKDYEGLYCVGCEMFYTKDELDKNGECFEHPGKKLDIVAETNYFFRLSKYKDQIKKIIESGELEIVPQKRKNEVLSFIENDLHDISISRSNERAKNWGVPVPGDNTQRIYVWFDALNIYQSGVGYGWDEEKYKKWWPADVHVIGKGITRFHAIFWPAFLTSAKLPLPKKLFVHGYLTINGQKMSKSIGNVIDPNLLIKKFGVEALRYYLLREIPSTEDGDFSESRMQEVYSSDLANELGNLLLRITHIAEQDGVELNQQKHEDVFIGDLRKHFNNFEFHKMLELIWVDLKALNKKTDDFTPWKKNSTERAKFLKDILNTLNLVGHRLQPFLPETAEKIISSTTGKIKKAPVLFPRLEV
ncbi:methionine--tRNA ligase [Candidatus Roizmanbacteria bacterium RIFCSPLOWO2_12_FULL_40_12]|uniref:Methionine--tRNA ligase n=1 Tax=Candidatus Roizmanbacteria bacterium RIFCSPLOWO2_01_FULL_40_42 TaxID=1802066 RepID=A0A1F7J4R2_9BACT|nr:MAG: methionine--tRNA ligase [Candidatus Roizmanbacteria bacterium RIFCSPHIGHO2_01_FULL_40_98]OGK27366.1 MAG: methionine--tRNA ligase [Candidatus Roizmanbacteria bacterium RIFCSPHIGHO2_02_FULL_40_53]OGK30762.1 MAG: methionine--tRNA ligase [Candidatus Roizmanbacteria bacterium RIFCSPHIGHO2_12_41_18]OGK36471.1 MAG: methionine--tRNA ligase [Candidatus Roizmanbacteria bacterium RIFCSPHIGHO2_12_FULL_40_130]OGK50599.1 MAG: methionine--tRNA ligase [Candidatus Roizmanbacteria bacterium RIFCSPLOWO2_0